MADEVRINEDAVPASQNHNDGHGRFLQLTIANADMGPRARMRHSPNTRCRESVPEGSKSTRHTLGSSSEHEERQNVANHTFDACINHRPSAEVKKHSFRSLPACYDDASNSFDRWVPITATHFHQEHDWTVAPLPFSRETERKTTRLSRTSALSSFIAQRYHLSCTRPGGTLDHEHPMIAMREIMYSSKSSTALASVQEPKYRWLLILLSILMMAHATPSIIIWSSGSVQEAIYYRFTALGLQGSSGAAAVNSLGIKDFVLRLKGCDLYLNDTKTSISGATMTKMFGRMQAMDGWLIIADDASAPSYPSRFQLEASDDAISWRMVGAPAWTAVNGGYEFDLDVLSDGRTRWDLAPSVAWKIGQTMMPLTSGFLLLLGCLLGFNKRLAASGEFAVYASGLATAMLAAWSTVHMYVEQNLDRNAMIECFMFACERFLLVLIVASRPKACHFWLFFLGGAVVIANVCYLWATPHRYVPRFIRYDFVVGTVLNLVNIIWRTWMIASAEKAVQSDKLRYKREWAKVLEQQHASIARLKELVQLWNGSAQTKVCRQLNSKRDHVKGSMRGLSTGVHEKSGFFRFSATLDLNGPIVSLDQVRLASFPCLHDFHYTGQTACQ
jgi:hypothetical protein